MDFNHPDPGFARNGHVRHKTTLIKEMSRYNRDHYRKPQPTKMQRRRKVSLQQTGNITENHNRPKHRGHETMWCPAATGTFTKQHLRLRDPSRTGDRKTVRDKGTGRAGDVAVRLYLLETLEKLHLRT